MEIEGYGACVREAGDYDGEIVGDIVTDTDGDGGVVNSGVICTSIVEDREVECCASEGFASASNFGETSSATSMVMVEVF